MDTLLLDQVLWDLCLDSSGNIAMASNPYAIAQDVASAIRVYLGELWYDTTQGVPYNSQVLGQNPPIALLKALFVKAALTVPEVVSAICYIYSISGRNVVGQVQITDTGGNVTALNIQTLQQQQTGEFTLNTSVLGGPNVLG
jgi:hypothetical protein